MLGLEVSNMIGPFAGPGGTTVYEIGTRNTATTLRLADGRSDSVRARLPGINSAARC